MEQLCNPFNGKKSRASMTKAHCHAGFHKFHGPVGSPLFQF
jgi:hypothetical protein